MFDIISICLSSIALVVALYSVFYTHYFNRYSIFVGDVDFDRDEEEGFPFLVSFNLINDSPKYIVIENVQLYGIDLRPDFEPPLEPMAFHLDQSPFSGTATIPSGNRLELSYFCASKSSFTVTVTANRRINGFSKSKSFNCSF